MIRLKRAAEQFEIKEIAIAGGVSANSGLRKTLEETGKELAWNVYIPKFEYCTDNAAMIAMVAHHQFLAKDFLSQNSRPMPRMSF